VEAQVAGVRQRYDLQSGAIESLTIKFAEYRRPPGDPVTSEKMKLLSLVLLNMVSDRAAPAQVANLEPKVSTAREAWQAGGETFDSQAAAHIAAGKAGLVAHLAMDTVDLGGV
jgi:hypothetical protein